MKLPDIVGVAGTNGSGKDTLSLLREKLEGALNVSLSDMLRHEATRRGMDYSRKSLGSISLEWEKSLGDGALVQKVLEYYRDERGGEGGLTISSVRRVSEAEAIKQVGGVVVWVDADRRTRYERLQAFRGRDDDKVDYETFCAQEDAELYNSTGEKGAMDLASIASVADVMIDNSFDSKEAYENYLIELFELS